MREDMNDVKVLELLLFSLNTCKNLLMCYLFARSALC